MIYVILGAGAAGITAAETIRQNDKDSAIVMISTDEYVHSRCMLHKYISGERDEKALDFAPEDFFETRNIYWIKGKKAEQIDTENRNVILEDQTKIHYDKLLIATGADSFIPPVGDFRTAGNVFGLRNLSDAQAIKAMGEQAENILVIGAGLVGLDAAYGFLEKKRRVTVVEMADRILPLQLDACAGKEYQRLFEQAGCRFLLGRKAVRTVSDENGKINTVVLDDDTEVPCDLIIVAAGVRPAIACIKGSRIAGERSIEVNEYMQTSVPDIYAAGDVTGLAGIWPNAMKQGAAAGSSMCGIKQQYIDRYCMKNTINFFGLTTLSLGRGAAEEGDEVLVREDSKSYKKAIIRDGKLDSILLQGDISYSGIYQYLIKNQIELGDKKERIFELSFADYFGTLPDGQYDYVV
ncbi:NAD(P)/FAD-dependent oxidoreductase [Clostridium sp. MCC353]|uniref:NAD(P)/FAD-dependent oxidoreductase n=1 Tax=Clostridium sp. MCC353 TaxID=2592646 RepID=UPI001C02ACED|nr:FAD-dependent oxidoreductase [Clostridium sp. MCC353]MBT9775498.1 NAD(P)/FAD-dependent oxidoreductase [Clostridium sp. MCC353]